MDVASKLRRWRETQGLTQAAASRIAGLPQPVWSRLENGLYKHISLRTAQRIQSATGGEVALADWLESDVAREPRKVGT